MGAARTELLIASYLVEQNGSDQFVHSGCADDVREQAATRRLRGIVVW
jgi:hypothetical protein